MPSRDPPLIATLIPHPSTPSPEVRRVAVSVSRPRSDRIELRYELHGRLASLVIAPRSTLPQRTDGLWQHTCFEAFVKQSAGASAYREYNFAPSGDWAAYAFTGYRTGMEAFRTPAPAIDCVASGEILTLSADIAIDHALTSDASVPAPLLLAISCVLEMRDGRRSYWALAHAGERPDFHHPSGFVLQA